MIIGIYAIFWEQQDLIYIGKSVDIESRIKRHKSSMINNKHTNYKVQNAYNKYGMPKFTIIEECRSNKLSELEKVWTEEFNALSASGLCIVNPETGIGNIGENNLASKHSRLTYLLIFRMLSGPVLIKVNNIAEVLGTTDSVVNSILYSRKHLWLKEKYPFRYSLMLSRNSVRNTYFKINKVSCILVSPEGIEYYVSNLTEFAKQHNLTASTLSKLYRKERSHHKNWTIK